MNIFIKNTNLKEVLCILQSILQKIKLAIVKR